MTLYMVEEPVTGAYFDGSRDGTFNFDLAGLFETIEVAFLAAKIWSPTAIVIPITEAML